jgi:hypothetical protein
MFFGVVWIFCYMVESYGDLCDRIIKTIFLKFISCFKVYLKLIKWHVILIGGKSSILLDVKPWDDETDMKKLEEAVRSVEIPGLTWGACMLKTFLSLFQCNLPSIKSKWLSD